MSHDVDRLDLQLAAMREAALAAKGGLIAAVMDACPGPHRPVQHRDGNPLWCNVCGRSNYGDRYGGAA